MDLSQDMLKKKIGGYKLGNFLKQMVEKEEMRIKGSHLFKLLDLSVCEKTTKMELIA